MPPLIRPHHFRPNLATAIDNAFQTTGLAMCRDASGGVPRVDGRCFDA